MRARGRFASRDSAVAESLASGPRPGSARRGWSTSSPTPTELVMIYSLVQRVGEHVIGRFQHISATQPSLVCLTADRQCDAREVAWEKQIRFSVVCAHPVEVAIKRLFIGVLLRLSSKSVTKSMTAISMPRGFSPFSRGRSDRTTTIRTRIGRS